MKLAIIGFGNIAVKHLEVARYLGMEVVASCNRSEQGNALAREHGITNTYTDYHQMVAKESPDALLVCVSFEHIFSVCKSLIPYQIPLLIEKPAGTSMDELYQLIDAANTFGTKVQVAMNRRHYANIHAAIEHAGGWDQITAVDVEWSETPIRLLEQKGYSREQVARIIYGNSIHGIDMATYYGGSIEEPMIQTKSFGERFRWYMQFSGISAQGRLVSFRSSWDHPVPWKMVLSAEGKRYVLAPLETCKVFLTDAKEPIDIMADVNEGSLKAGFLRQMTAFKNLVELPRFENHHDLTSCIPSMEIAEKFYRNLYR
ncbi:MAG TPA: Gfo/Idh/MocA family oxidoreductase [Chitinophagaceae bacterium]|nr:Gfo/Idh/MocA family oxidoreductase [Chitinophagaceae bacterium]